MLTKEQLAHYEVAARLYVERTGGNPEAFFDRPHPKILGTTERVRIWHLAAEELHDLSMQLTSLRDAAIAKEETKNKIITPSGANDA